MKKCLASQLGAETPISPTAVVGAGVEPQTSTQLLLVTVIPQSRPTTNQRAPSRPCFPEGHWERKRATQHTHTCAGYRRLSQGDSARGFHLLARGTVGAVKSLVTPTATEGVSVTGTLFSSLSGDMGPLSGPECAQETGVPEQGRGLGPHHLT